MKIKDIPTTATLIQNGSEVAELLEYFGTDAQQDGYTYLFVEVGDGEYTAAWGSYTLDLDAAAYPIF